MIIKRRRIRYGHVTRENSLWVWIIILYINYVNYYPCVSTRVDVRWWRSVFQINLSRTFVGDLKSRVFVWASILSKWESWSASWRGSYSGRTPVLRIIEVSAGPALRPILRVLQSQRRFEVRGRVIKYHRLVAINLKGCRGKCKNRKRKKHAEWTAQQRIVKEIIRVCISSAEKCKGNYQGL